MKILLSLHLVPLVRSEYAGYLDLSNEVGAISGKRFNTKGSWCNPGPRIAETPSGVLNCIGLENPGAEHLLRIFSQNLRNMMY